jgi:hypothetical protein
MSARCLISLKEKQMSRNAGRALAALIGVTVIGGVCAGLVLASSAGQATPAVTTVAGARGAHIVAMAPSSARALTSTHAPSAARAAVSRRNSPIPAAVPSPRRIKTVEPKADSLPAANTEKWTPVGEPATRTVTGHDIRENECASVGGATTWIQQGFSGDGGQTAAIQDTFVFGSSAAAHAAYQHMATSMAHCQATTRAYQKANHTPANAVVRQTASLARAIAWERTWTGVMGISAEGPQTNHIYLAVGGPVLIVLEFTEFPGRSVPYDVAHDPQVLAMLGAELARY